MRVEIRAKANQYGYTLHIDGHDFTDNTARCLLEFNGPVPTLILNLIPEEMEFEGDTPVRALINGKWYLLEAVL